MKRFLAIVLTLSLAGCATYDSYGYRDDGYYEDRYDEGGYDHYSYRGNRSAFYGYSAYPDYVYWSDYYSVLWPVYRGYYDPFYAPGFYYGVTWYPRSYFGLNHYWNAWPYYHAYAPYRYSYWDGYYDNWDRGRGRYGRHMANGHPHSGGSYMYGSARNEAEQLSRRTGAAYAHNGTQPGLQYDPFAAQRTSPLSRERMTRDPVRGHYPQSGVQSAGAFGNGDGGIRSRDELRRMQPSQRPGNSINSSPYPSGQSAPSRARSYDRGAPARDASGRQTGWSSDTPAEQEPSMQRFQRSRPAPYYREVGGAQVPVTRQPYVGAMPERGSPRQQEIQQYRSERAQSGYTYRQSAPVYQANERGQADPYQRGERVQMMQRQDAPQREVFQQRSAPRYEAPARMDVERSRPERSEPSGGRSARDEVRQTRDEN